MKKILLFILTLALILTAFVSCGNTIHNEISQDESNKSTENGLTETALISEDDGLQFELNKDQKSYTVIGTFNTSMFQYDTKNKENKNWYVNFKNLKSNIN